MAIDIHPTAIVDKNAVLDPNVSIGPFCVVGPDAFIGSGTKLIGHVTIMGNVRIGHDNTIYPYSVIGSEPQDKSYKGAPTWVVIGDRNIFREMNTVHRASEKEYGITRVGSDNYFMTGCHIAHDCIVGSNITIANNCMLGGHVCVHDYAALSGGVGVHHFATIGSYSFTGGLSKISSDAPPFMLCEGNPAKPTCVNVVGLKRRGFSQAEVNSICEAHRYLYRTKVGLIETRQRMQLKGTLTAPVEMLLAFVERQNQGRVGRAREAKRAA